MNWIRNVVRPKIRAVFRREKAESTETKWFKCGGCGQMIYYKEFNKAQMVCPYCAHHHRIGPKERFNVLFDGGIYDQITVKKGNDDPLKFRDTKKYTDRLKENRAKTDQQDAVVAAVGRLADFPAVIAVQNFAFLGGSLGVGAGDALIAAAMKAIEEKAAFIVFTAAGGARMQEGILSLMQLPRTTVAVEMLRDQGLPYIVVLTDPTTGGVTASYAMLGDIAIAEPGALIAFAGPRVIEDTIREQLPEGFQRAEYLLEHGMIDMVVPRSEMPDVLRRIVDMLMRPIGGTRDFASQSEAAAAASAAD